MLGREMTADLQNESQNALARAQASGQNVTIALVSKQVSFGKLTALLMAALIPARSQGSIPT